MRVTRVIVYDAAGTALWILSAPLTSGQSRQKKDYRENYLWEVTLHMNVLFYLLCDHLSYPGYQVVSIPKMQMGKRLFIMKQRAIWQKQRLSAPRPGRSP